MPRMSPDEFGRAIEEALGAIPRAFDRYLENVAVEFQPRPSRWMLEGGQRGDRRELLGLYVGRPLTERSIEDVGLLPDRVILFQRNIEAACRNRRELLAEIRKTVLHEIGHHFGMTEEELDGLGYG